MLSWHGMTELIAFPAEPRRDPKLSLIRCHCFQAHFSFQAQSAISARLLLWRIPLALALGIVSLEIGVIFNYPLCLDVIHLLVTSNGITSPELGITRLELSN